MALLASVAALGGVACSSDDRPPRPARDGPDASGGASSAGRGSGGASSGGASAGGRVGSGGASSGGAGGGGTGAAAGGGGVIDCGAFDPEKVYLLGSLEEGEPQRSIALPEAPTAICSTLLTDQPVLLDALTQSVLYVHSQNGALWTFRRDSFLRAPGSTTSTYDAQPESNDELLVTACTGSDQVLSAMVEPDTGRVWTSCDGERWFDDDGEELPLGGTRLYHLGYGGLKLAIDTLDALVLVNVTGGTLPISGCSEAPVRAVRATERGFWIARDPGDALALESIDAEGNCDRLGDFAPLPSGISGGVEVALDGDGNAYQLATQGDFDLVVERTTPPGTSRVVYTEANAPAGGQDWENLRFYLRVADSDLFTGG